MGLSLRRKSARNKNNCFRLEALEPRRFLDADALELGRFESEAELEQHLIDDAVNQYGHLFGQPDWGHFWNFGNCRECDVFFAAPEAGGVADDAERDHSDTNTQVEGVDEADLVETDGNYIYTLAGQELVIADAWQPNELSVTSRVAIEGYPLGQYLTGDRLTVLSQAHRTADGITEPFFGGGGPDILIDIDIDVAFDIAPWQPTESFTRVTIIDIADRQHPQVVQTTELEGNYTSSRAIGDNLYIVSNSELALPAPESICEEAPEGEAACTFETQEAYFARMEGQIIQHGTPSIVMLDENDDEIDSASLLDATDIYRPTQDSYGNLVAVSVIDMSVGEPSMELSVPESVGIPSSYASTVYASAESIYLTNPDWGRDWVDAQESTSILKLDILNQGRSVDLVATGSVPGRLLNSFSLDEYTGDDGAKTLRIATTDGFGRNSDNRVRVLQQSGDDLEVIGSTTSLAPGEQIFAVRYDGPTAYVVTFVQTDPLFTIDLSDPTSPTVKGELHITGFSNHLKKVSDDFMIGLGREADPRTGRAQELQVSLFDVSDINDPALADRYTFDVPGWAWSEAISDHHALGYYPDYQILTIPVSNDGWVWVDRDLDGSQDFQSYRPRTDLFVFKINLPDDDNATTAGIEFLGTVQNDTAVRRSVRIENYLYSISDDSISVSTIEDLKDVVGYVHFGQEPVGVPVFDADPAIESVQQALIAPETSAPQVTHLRASGSNWKSDFIGYLERNQDNTNVQDQLDRTGDNSSPVLPFADADQIKVEFNEDVLVGLDDIVVSDSTHIYTVQNFDYDTDTHTAVWTFTEPLSGKVDVQVRGVTDLARNNLDGNANGNVGGSFTQSLRVLSGDVDGDGRVDGSDIAKVLAKSGLTASDIDYLVSHDIDGDGRIDESDVTEIAQSIGDRLPDSDPVLGDANGDGRFNSSDLIHVMQQGLYRTGETADFGGGDWNGDGRFNESDFVAAFEKGTYEND